MKRYFYMTLIINAVELLKNNFDIKEEAKSVFASNEYYRDTLMDGMSEDGILEEYVDLFGCGDPETLFDNYITVDVDGVQYNFEEDRQDEGQHRDCCFFKVYCEFDLDKYIKAMDRGIAEDSGEDNEIAITVFRDTVSPDSEGDDNIAIILVKRDVLTKYFKERILPTFKGDDKTVSDEGLLDEWLDEYTADATTDLYDYIQLEEKRAKKEYYQKLYDEKYDTLLEEAKNKGCVNPELEADKAFSECGTAEEVVGYYITWHGDDAFKDWVESSQYYTRDKMSSEQGRAITRILSELYGNADIKDKAYYERLYEEKYNKLLEHWTLELQGISNADPGQAALDDYCDSPNAEEVVAYYVYHYGDDAYQTWMENLRSSQKGGKSLTYFREQDEEVTTILEALTGEIWLDEIEWDIPEGALVNNKLSDAKAVPYSENAEDMAVYLSLKYGFSPKAFRWYKDEQVHRYRDHNKSSKRTGSDIQKKEYYIAKYQNSLGKCIENAYSDGVKNPEAEGSIQWDIQADAEEVAGYYLYNCNEQAYQEWMNTVKHVPAKKLVPRDIDVTKILREMCSKEKASDADRQYQVIYITYASIGIAQIQKAYISQADEDCRIEFPDNEILAMLLIDKKNYASLDLAIADAKRYCMPKDMFLRQPDGNWRNVSDNQ